VNTTAATQRASSGRSRLVSSTAARRCWCATAISPQDVCLFVALGFDRDRVVSIHDFL
jgi:hypothetical protein